MKSLCWLTRKLMLASRATSLDTLRLRSSKAFYLPPWVSKRKQCAGGERSFQNSSCLA